MSPIKVGQDCANTHLAHQHLRLLAAELEPVVDAAADEATDFRFTLPQEAAKPRPALQQGPILRCCVLHHFLL